MFREGNPSGRGTKISSNQQFIFTFFFYLKLYPIPGLVTPAPLSACLYVFMYLSTYLSIYQFRVTPGNGGPPCKATPPAPQIRRRKVKPVIVLVLLTFLSVSI